MDRRRRLVGIGAVLLIVLAIVLLLSREDLAEKADEPPAQTVEPIEVEHALAPNVAEEIPPTSVEVAREPVVSTLDTQIADPADGFLVRGRVVNESNAPVPDAQIVLYHQNADRYEIDRLIDQTYSDTSGEFEFPKSVRFSKVNLDPEVPEQFVILATHASYALTWQTVSLDDSERWYDLRLTAAQAETITVTDQSGQPIQGARVWLSGAWDRPDPKLGARQGFNLRSAESPLAVVTDAQGRAAFQNIPKSHWYFHAAKPGYAQGLAFEPDNTIVLVKAATVSGRVTDERGNGLSGIEVYFDPDWYGGGDAALTDVDGTYRTELRPRGWDMSSWEEGKMGQGDYEVSARSVDYISAPQEIYLEPGDAIDNLDFVAVPGVEIECHVVQEGSGEPLGQGARFLVTDGTLRADLHTDGEGTLRTRLFPGRVQLVMVDLPPNVFLAAGEQETRPVFNFEAEPPLTEVTMTVPAVGGRITTLSGRVIGPAGAISGVEIVGSVSGIHANSPPYGTTIADGSFALENVPLGQTVHLMAYSADYAYGAIAAFNIPEQEEELGEVELRLEPTVAGEVEVDPEWIELPLVVRVTVAEGPSTFAGGERPYELVGENRVRVLGLQPDVAYTVNFAHDSGSGLQMRLGQRHVVGGR